jgi:hypothetical protein
MPVTMLITLRFHVDNYGLVVQVAEKKWKGLVGASMVMIVNLASKPDDIAPDTAWPLQMANVRPVYLDVLARHMIWQGLCSLS